MIDHSSMIGVSHHRFSEAKVARGKAMTWDVLIICSRALTLQGICLPKVRKLVVALWWRSSCAYGRIVSPFSGLIIRRHPLMDSRCG